MSEAEAETEKNQVSQPVLKEVRDNLAQRYSDEMKWIDDVERKASSLIAVIGVVLALSVPLLGLLHTLLAEQIINDMIVFFPTGLFLSACILLYITYVIFLGVSLYHAHKAHKISVYKVPNVSELVNKCKQGEELSLDDVYKKQIVEYESSISTINENREHKVGCVKISQRFFVVGASVLIATLLFSLLCFLTSVM